MSDQNITGTELTLMQHREQMVVRRERLAELRKQGIAFPNNFRPDHTARQIHDIYGNNNNDELTALYITVNVAGRIMLRRMMGKASFVTLQDGSGAKIQLYVTRDSLPQDYYKQHFKHWDLGDIIAATGYLFKTKTGELSIHCTALQLLTKSLRPLPDKFHGLADPELCYRQRYLDLITNSTTRDRFRCRSQLIMTLRQFMADNHFMEVETPMMQVIPGGAAARPFTTHHNALDIVIYLRVAPELYLKRLVVGGFERVFEINRNFRNEGISSRHNPEFTMMELYMAYADYHDLITLTEDLFRTLADKVIGGPCIKYAEHTFDFSQPFARLTMKEAICHYDPTISSTDLDDKKIALGHAAALKIKVDSTWGLGRIQCEIFEKIAEPYLIQPTFITEYPAEVSPLARRNDANPFITDRFELFIGGREIGNGFSELNDAEDQDERFKEQVRAKESGDDEAMFYDQDYITALEYGLPPTAGLGIGIDRLVMLFTNSPSIRDVILFPTMRKTAAQDISEQS